MNTLRPPADADCRMHSNWLKMFLLALVSASVLLVIALVSACAKKARQGGGRGPIIEQECDARFMECPLELRLRKIEAEALAHMVALERKEAADAAEALRVAASGAEAARRQAHADALQQVMNTVRTHNAIASRWESSRW